MEGDEIDRINIHRASLKAMRAARGVPGALAGVRGRRRLPFPTCGSPSARFSRRSPVTAIAAASILAKVTRNRLMMALHGEDPRYG